MTGVEKRQAAVEPSSGRVRVAVCITTYQRPLGLERLLNALGELRFERPRDPEIHLLVIDNDPDASAREMTEAMAPGMAWPLRYVHEPRRGISAARNRAIASAREVAELVAFIDDDEVPAPDWLDELLRVQAEYDADVVAGPALERFEGEVPAWIEKGRFFTPRRGPTGSHRRDPGAGNVLIRMAALPGPGEPFDERFGLTGGEDTHLFLRMAHAGRTMVWADEAIVYESVPPSRAKVGWILRRVYRTANTWSVCERELDSSLRVLAMRVAKGAARMAFGAALLPVAWIFGRHMVVRSLWYLSFGAGNLTGLTRMRYYEYRSTHGQ